MRKIYYILIALVSTSLWSCAQSYPGLILTTQGVEKIKSEVHPPLFKKTLQSAIEKVDHAILEGIDVPTPKDMAGGYTHEQHKNNYKYMQLAGALYQINGDKKYAEYVKQTLMQYADKFSSWPVHPTNRSYATGKVFWQCLNDSNWLVFTSQAYDAIHEYLTKEEVEYLDQQLFRPYADFISIENPQFFNRVHNHSTWGNAAVGMIGLVMNDEELINRALYGLKINTDNSLAKDNDGGFIYEKGKAKAGFFAQIDYAFSPDGYYTEGPYYQRYAMLPFMLFAQAIENKRPDLKIFEYREGLLVKGVKALLYQTNASGEFFPINDAQKGMSIKAGSVVTALNIAYGISKDPDLINAARLQNSVLLDQNGFEIATQIEKLPLQPFEKSSIELKDGKDGDEGALGILRSGSGKDEFTVVFKYTGQGLGHGHYDKLSYAIYDGDVEVLQDYGAARWVNIDQKEGGRYLPENKTWAKQTIAHNTLVVDKKSHFGGKYEIANLNHSEGIFFNTDNPKAHAAGAVELNAYAGVEMRRIILLWKDDHFDKPVVLDIFEAVSDEEHIYDFPYQFAGQIMSQNFTVEGVQPEVMGDAHGYQHLYSEAIAEAGESIQMNWFKDNKFYTMTSESKPGDNIILGRMGANDPDFNLRRDALLIHRKNNASKAIFLSAIESHGTYSPVTERPIQPYSKIKSIETVENTATSVEIEVKSKSEKKWRLKINKQTGKVEIKERT
ncbi:MAG: heparinase II/III family protein [Saprospiraceae bacterium]|nr:heparinase II/III family protein [Saprospiraceae bacterium]